MALPASAPKPKQIATILFRHGPISRFRAEKFTLSRSVVTGQLTNLSWEGIDGPQPMFIDFDEVIAVSIEDER